jgi:lipopolysaccharide biosynthesis glycosyltransferase
MPKRAIVTLAIGKVWQSLPVLNPPMKEYARYCDADFIKITTPQHLDYPHIFYEKYQIYDLFNKYDTVLYLDGDVLITPIAFDSITIFDAFKDSRNICLFNERAHTDWQTRAHIAEHWDAIGKQIPPTWNGANYNAGVMLVPKSASGLFRLPPKSWCTKSWTADQITLNAMIAHRAWKVTDLDRRWNEMPFSSDNPDLRSAKFVHYGGWNYYSVDIEFMIGMAKAWPYLPLVDNAKPGHGRKKTWAVPLGRVKQ